MSKNIDDYIVWTAVITPMNEDGSIDYANLEKLLKEQEKVGNAVTLLGSTGEALNIDLSERKQILEFTEKLNLKVPIMCGVGGFNLNEQLDWINYLNLLRLDAYMLVVPLYAKPGIKGQYGWFKALLDTAEKPCAIYNIPSRTGKKLEHESTEMLADHPKFWTIKEASASIQEFKQYARDMQGKKLLSGDDLMLPDFARAGAAGVVSVAANVWPEATKLYAHQCISGNFADHRLWAEAIKALFAASNPVPIKALLHHKKLISSPYVRPPLSIDDMRGLDELIEYDHRIAEWLNSNR